MTPLILIAEDDADIRGLLKLYLEGEGLRVLEAADGTDALALARLGTGLPLVLTALYAFLSIRVEEASILDFLCRAANFLLLRQQRYEWGLNHDP